MKLSQISSFDIPLFALFVGSVASASLIRRQAAPSYELTVGTDGPQPAETVGWVQSHTALIVSDLDASLEFYTKILGFRSIFTVGYDWFKIAYIGYPERGKNGTGFQTGEEMAREATNREGLIELVWSETSQDISPIGAGFSHLGLVVKDPAQFYDVTEKAAASLGRELEWYQKPGENGGLKLVQSLGINGLEEIPDWLLEVHPADSAMLADPDGYAIEVIPVTASY